MKYEAARYNSSAPWLKLFIFFVPEFWRPYFRRSRGRDYTYVWKAPVLDFGAKKIAIEIVRDGDARRRAMMRGDIILLYYGRDGTTSSSSIFLFSSFVEVSHLVEI
jgi:hypothetical protein